MLCECRLNSISNCIFAIENRDNHRCLKLEVLLFKIRSVICRGVYLGTQGGQVCRDSSFHLRLCLPIVRVHIVKLLFSTQSVVFLLLGIKHFVEVEDGTLRAEKEAQVVESGIQVIVPVGLFCECLAGLCLQQQQLSEIKIISDAPLLVINHEVRQPLSAHTDVVVAVHAGGISVDRHAQPPVHGMKSQREWCGLPAEQDIIGSSQLGHFPHRFG